MRVIFYELIKVQNKDTVVSLYLSVEQIKCISSESIY